MFTISTPGELKVNNWLSEVAVYVVVGASINRLVEDLLGVTKFDNVAWLVVIGQEEGGLVGYSLSLLHVVGHDNNAHGLLELQNGLLNAAGRTWVQG